jgi:hypothetical protein
VCVLHRDAGNAQYLKCAIRPCLRQALACVHALEVLADPYPALLLWLHQLLQ